MGATDQRRWVEVRLQYILAIVAGIFMLGYFTGRRA
jgi:hypothetical protein